MKICPICQAHSWETWPLPFRALSRSDCLPVQGKKCLLRCQSCGLIGSDQEWSLDFYSDYDLHDVFTGREQLLFSALEHPQPRSRVLLQQLQQRQLLPEAGRSLDIGCHHGFFSAELKKLLPAWDVYGYEPLPRVSPWRERYLPPGHFLHGSLAALDCPADLISLIHVLEHLPDPRQCLITLRAQLRPGGRLLLQVPDYSQNPYDLVIVDHLWHWQRHTLFHLLQQAGFEVLLLEHLLPKELTALCQVTEQPPASLLAWDPTDSLTLQEALQHLDALQTRVSRFEAYSLQEKGRRVVMGTAIAAACVAGLLQTPPDAYLDEAPSPAGRQFAGRPVWTRRQLPAQGVLFLPFPPRQAEEIRLRLQAELPHWQFV